MSRLKDLISESSRSWDENAMLSNDDHFALPG